MLHQPEAGERLGPKIGLNGKKVEPLGLLLALGKDFCLCSQCFISQLCKQITIVEARLEQ